MQSTDKKVNEIVPPLYKLAPDAHSMAQLEVCTALTPQQGITSCVVHGSRCWEMAAVLSTKP